VTADDRGSGAAVVALDRRHATPSSRPRVVAACRLAGRGLARCVLRVRVQGDEHVPRSGPVLLAGNHSSLLDGPLVYFFSPRPAAMMTKSEVFVEPWARCLRWLGLVPVRRGTPDRSALTGGSAVLAGGGALGVFPEGTRGTGALDQVADGLAFLALRSGAPVVPIAVHGTAAAWPRGRPWPRLRAPVRVVFGPPVRPDARGAPRARSTVRAAAEQLRLVLVEHVQRTGGAGT
jgi:1-acyl-sn-glycerol-3-phosphate acyltransferase